MPFSRASSWPLSCGTLCTRVCVCVGGVLLPAWSILIFFLSNSTLVEQQFPAKKPHIPTSGSAIDGKDPAAANEIEAEASHESFSWELPGKLFKKEI